MLAGRKLLLADDSLTIQKVVELTFADEGVDVLCVSNGRDAIERIEAFAPDVVLADVLMPQMSGYEVCEYVKQNERLKHIPVMLLVGSFEPFDLTEARRVGADDTLTKPFQSIRGLIEKVGQLVSGRRADAEATTAELPKANDAVEPEHLSQQEIAITTADTQPLSPELGHITQEWALPGATEEAVMAEEAVVIEDEGLSTSDTKVDEPKMESNLTERPEMVSHAAAGDGDVLLDLGDYQSGSAAARDEFDLDLNLDEAPEPSPSESAFPTAAFAREASNRVAAQSRRDTPSAKVGGEVTSARPNELGTMPEAEQPSIEAAPASQAETSLQYERISDEPELQPARTGDSQISLQQLAPDVIDAIARRAIEQLSEKVIQEIAWEVVPQLAERLIKRQLEEKNS